MTRLAVAASHSLEQCSTSYRLSSVSRSPRIRLQPIRCTGAGLTRQDAEQPQRLQPRRLVVKSVPAARAAAPPPQPVPVEHSSAYLLRNRRQLATAQEEEQRVQQDSSSEPFNGTAMEWMLRKADESLDEIEENPPEYAKRIYDISTGPIGKAASSTVTSAAKVTVKVGTEAFKAAVPVGKWALREGMKLAVGAVAKGISAAASSKKEDNEKKK